MQLQKWNSVLEILKEIPGNPSKKKEALHSINNMNYMSNVLYMRGIAYFNMNKPDLAKKALTEAIKMDFKWYYSTFLTQSFQAFEFLQNHQLLLPKEEENLLKSVHTYSSFNESFEFIQLLYTTGSNLNKLSHVDMDKLKNVYKLNMDSDVLLHQAKALFNESKFYKCLEITSNIIEMDPLNESCLVTHIACLYELNEKND
jgi:anaphase-promoting complex subunit 6